MYSCEVKLHDPVPGTKMLFNILLVKVNIENSYISTAEERMYE